MPRRRGRPPSLSARGRWLAASALVLQLAGLALQNAQLLGLGVVLLGLLFLVVIAQYPTALFVWRRHVELAWKVSRPKGEPTLYAGRDLELTIELRNRAPRRLGTALVTAVTSPSLEVAPVTLPTPSRGEASTRVPLVARSVGLAMLHGASVSITDTLGLTHIEAYFPSPIALPILPRPGLVPPHAALVQTGGPDRAQRSSARQRGQGGDVRELRDHQPGDPWKQIAWKASARRGRLMVRELERETQTSHLFVLDVSGRMRKGPVGRTPLDVAIEVTSRLCRGALEAGDRVGLVTVDGRIVASALPSDRPSQRGMLLELLTQAPAVYDEDLTDLSDAELCATVGRYLLMQEGQDARVAAPPVDDPRWSHLVAGPSGELYDLGVLLRAVALSRDKQRHLAHVGRSTSPRALDPNMAHLRTFCRERAIPLPVREHEGRGVDGLVAALSPTTGRLPDRVVVLSMLDGAEREARKLGQALQRARRHGTRVLWVAPLGVALSASRTSLTELLSLEHRRELEVLRARGRAMGLLPQLCEDPARFRLDVRAARRTWRAA